MEPLTKPEDVLPGVVVLLAVAPGYIAHFLWSLVSGFRAIRTDFETLIQSFVISLVIQLLFSWLTVLWIAPFLRRGVLLDHPGDLIAWLILVCIAVPIAGGSLLGLVMRHEASLDIWDSFFEFHAPTEGSRLVIELKTGELVAGAWSEQSYATAAPSAPGLFLGKEWSVDRSGHPIQPLPTSQGLLIPDGREIRSIRILSPPVPPIAGP